MDVDGMTRFLDLPSCLIIDILLRLPLKALLTCRCVCKDWIRLFSDPSFIKLHLAASPIHILDQSLREDRIFQFAQVMEDKCTGNLDVKIVKFRTKLNLPSSTSIYQCINSCNGLLCLMDDDTMFNQSRFAGSVCVCNPILGEWVSISVPDRNNSYFSLALVLSAKNNQYNVFHCFNYYGFEIYTLGGTRQWRSIDETLGCRLLYGSSEFNTFLHGSVHWTDFTHVSHREEHFICCFDVDNEKFRRLSLPRPERKASITQGVQLGAINGCLCAFYSCHIIYDAEMWEMKEYGVEKSWTMILAICSAFIRDAPEIMTYDGGLEYPVLLFALNEEEILVRDSREGLLCYNTKRKRLKHGKMFQRRIDNFYYVTAYNPSFVSLQDVAKGEQVMLSRSSFFSISAMVKTCKGRRKIDMVRIQKECNRSVTYSKRRAGVFKKASELTTLCGSEIAIIVFSPGGKAFSFGHPNVESVLDRYLTGEIPRRTSTLRLVEAHRTAVYQDLNMQLTEVLNEVEKEKKYGQELDRIRSERQSQHWWESPIQTLNVAQLEQLKAALLQLKQKIQAQAEQIEILSAAQALQTFPANAFVPDRNAAAFPPAPNAFPTAPNAPAFPTAPNASAFPTAMNAFQRAALNVFPPAPNSNAAGAFESRPDLNPRFPPSNQSAAGMINNEVVPFGRNSRFGNNGSF